MCNAIPRLNEFSPCGSAAYMVNRSLILPGTSRSGDLVTFQNDVPCQGCFYCDCVNLARVRGQPYGYCCGDTNGGPGCTCPRTNVRICPSIGGISGGTCSTTGFPLASDAFTASGVAGAGLARNAEKAIGFARTALLGRPPSIVLTGLRFGSRVVCPGLWGNRVIVQTTGPGVDPECVSGDGDPGEYRVIEYPAVYYDLRFGTVILVRTMPISTTPKFWYLRPFLINAQPCITGLETDMSDIDNPPDLARGFQFIDTNGDLPFTAVSAMLTLTIENAAQAAAISLPVSLIGTKYYATTSSATTFQALCLSTLPNTNTENDVFPLQFMTPFNSSRTNFSLSGGGTVQLMTNLMAVAKSTGCVPLPTVAGPYLTSGKKWVNTIGSLLQNCKTEYAYYCNGPLPFTYTRNHVGSLQAILTFTDGGTPPVQTDTTFLPVTAPMFLTIGTTGGYLYLAYAQGANGAPGILQRGFDWLLSNPAATSTFLGNYVLLITISTQQAALTGLQANKQYCTRSTGTCSFVRLILLSPLLPCDLYQVNLINPPTLRIADCDTCTNCLCNSGTAERADGSLCCPNGRIGFNCTQLVSGCVQLEVGVVCSGNGDATFPGSINGTGCYFNTSTTEYQCACLPGFAPPVCKERFDQLCGVPHCGAHGNCTEVGLGTAATWECVCADGYQGVQCQFPVTECFGALGDIACSGHGFCDDPDADEVEAGEASGFATPVCVCDDGYTGAICEQSLEVPCLETTTDTTCSDRGVCVFEQFCPLIYPALIRTASLCTNCSAYFNAFARWVLVSGLNIEVLDPTQSFFVGDAAFATNQTGLSASNLRGDPIPDASVATDAAVEAVAVAALPCTNTSNVPLLTGEYEAGVYCFSGSPATVTLIGSVSLQGNASSVFVFIIPNALVTQDLSTFSLSDTVTENNVYFIVGTSATLGVESSFAGVLVADTWIDAPSSLLMTGRLIAVGGPLRLTAAQVTVPAVPTIENSCTAPPTNIDLCNFTAPGNASATFCNARVGPAKKLLSIETEFQQQTLSLQELICMTTNFTVLRGFTILNWLGNYCNDDVESMTVFFLVNNQIQFNVPCPTEPPVQNANNYLRLLFYGQEPAPYRMNRLCVLVSSITGISSFLPSSAAMREAVFSRSRIDYDSSTSEASRSLLLQLCQRFAVQNRAPFYAVDTIFTRCWIPSVPSVTSTIQALSAYSNFIYNTDIHNPDTWQFWVAPTSSIPFSP